MPTYNKLVRDKIPEIIKESGKQAVVTTLSEEEFLKELKKKATEELDEYLAASSNEESLEELADLLEIIHALAMQHGSSMEEVEAIRRIKAEERGAFQDKVFLVEVRS